MKTYMSAIIVFVVGHGASAWAHPLMLVRSKPIRRWWRVQWGILIRMSGAFSTTSFEALGVLLGITSLDLELRRRAVVYWPKNVQKVMRVMAVTMEWNQSTKGGSVRDFLWGETWAWIFSTISRTRTLSEPFQIKSWQKDSISLLC